MTSNTKKGTKKEGDVLKILESYEYDVCRTFRKPIYLPGGRIVTQENDFFGCLDLIAKNWDHTLFVQVTDANNYAAHIKKFLGQKWPESSFVQIWAWYAGRRTINRNFKKERRYTLAQVYKVYERDKQDGEFKFKKIVDADGTYIGTIDDDYQSYIKKKKGGI